MAACQVIAEQRGVSRRRGSPGLAQYHTRSIPLRSGDYGVGDTITLMESLVEQDPEGAQNPEIRRQAVNIVRGLPPRDTTAEIRALFRFVKDNIRFTGEHDELLQTPLTTLQLGAGDCDDYATLLCALARALGHPARFITVAADETQPNEFTHVYCEVFDRRLGRWTALDPTVPGAYAGWEAPDVMRRQQYRTMGLYSPTHGVGPRTLGVDEGDVADLISKINASPLTQALAYRVAPQPTFSIGTGYGQSGVSNVPSWAWLLLAGVLGYAALKR